MGKKLTHKQRKRLVNERKRHAMMGEWYGPSEPEPKPPLLPEFLLALLVAVGFYVALYLIL